jgi:predicted double-glycine peptidase
VREGLCGLAVICVMLPGLAQAQRPVVSLLEKREERVVIQRWDVSCGAAALATILNYQLGDPISEREIAETLIARDEYLEDPDLVLARQGFSLLDLKRFVDERGYQGIGYGNLEFQDLIDLAPIMVAVEFTGGYPHFVIFRGARGNRVLLADPAFGNRTMLAAKFESAWIDYPDFGRVGFVVMPPDGIQPVDGLAPRPSDFVSLR